MNVQAECVITRKAKVVVVGLGSPLLTDDSAGLRVIDLLEQKGFGSHASSVELCCNYSGGMDLLYDLDGYGKAIIIDSVVTGNASPGTIHEFDLENTSGASQPRLFDAHGVDLRAVLEMGSRCGYHMPSQVVIIGIEGTEFEEFSEEPTEAVKLALAPAVEKVIQKIEIYTRS